MASMLTKDAIQHFGTQAALARALNIRQQSITDWGDTVPPLRQIQLEKLTAGDPHPLKASPDVFGVATGPLPESASS